MAAYPSAADYSEAYDEPGPTRLRKKRLAPAVPQPNAPNMDQPGPPAPGSQPPGQPLFGVGYNPPPTPAPVRTDIAGPSTPALPPGPEIDPKVGIPTEGLNKTGKRLAEIEALRKADPTSKIHNTDWGYEYDPPERHPSRFRQALMGALQGALAGASQTGSLAGALGGAATGTAAGAINPRLMLALKRDQDIRRAQGQLHDDLGLQREIAQIGGIGAQTEENLAQAQEARAKANMAYAGEYTDPDTGEIIRMTPEQAAALRQRDRAEKGRTQRGGRGSGNIHYEQDAEGTYGIYRDPTTGKLISEKVPGAPGKTATDSQSAQAAEGQREAEEADSALQPLRGEYDHYAEQLKTNEAALQQKKAIFRERMNSPEVQQQMQRDQLLGRQTPMIDIDGEKFPLLAVKDDPDYQNGTLQQTVTNTQSIRKRLPDLQNNIDTVNKEGRAGRAKSARTKQTSSGKQKSSDGKWHYTTAEVEASAKSAGATVEEFMKALSQRSDVVIDQ